MPTFGTFEFGSLPFGEDEGAATAAMRVQFRVTVQLEAITRPAVFAVDHEAEVHFQGESDTVGDITPEVDVDLTTVSATGAFTASADVVPIGIIVDAAESALSAAGALSGDAEVVAGGQDIDAGTVLWDASGRIYGEIILARVPGSRVLLDAPTTTVRAALEASVIRVWRTVDILNSDESIWMLNVGFIGGSVTADLGSDERRTFDLTLDNTDETFTPSPYNLWYDKIIRIRRGVTISDTHYEFNLGHFMIDRIAPTGTMASEVSISGRDYGKLLTNSRIEAPVAFKKGTLIGDVIRPVAFNAGAKRIAPITANEKLPEDLTFDADTSRWEIISELALAYSYDVFFNRAGTLIVQGKADPATQPPVISIGHDQGNMIKADRSTSDSEMYNHVVVVASGGDQDLPVWAAVENNEPGSPTRIARIGRRTKRFESALVKTKADALRIASNFLSVSGLEQYEVSFESLNYPWLDVGSVMEIKDDNASAGDPTRFLLTSLTFPLAVGPMTGTAKRITIVGKNAFFSQDPAPRESEADFIRKWLPNSVMAETVEV